MHNPFLQFLDFSKQKTYNAEPQNIFGGIGNDVDGNIVLL